MFRVPHKDWPHNRPEDRILLVFEPPKPSMLQGITDLFELFATSFKVPKFRAGILRSFISTGCLQVYNADKNVVDFVQYTKQKTCGTMKLTPTGTRNDHEGIANIADSLSEENLEIVHAMNAYLDYDSDDENAMNAILDL